MLCTWGRRMELFNKMIKTRSYSKFKPAQIESRLRHNLWLRFMNSMERMHIKNILNFWSNFSDTGIRKPILFMFLYITYTGTMGLNTLRRTYTIILHMLKTYSIVLLYRPIRCPNSKTCLPKNTDNNIW